MMLIMMIHAAGDAFPEWRAEQSNGGMVIGMQYNKVRTGVSVRVSKVDLFRTGPVCSVIVLCACVRECVCCVCAYYY
jgi:hypothetical protein